MISFLPEKMLRTIRRRWLSLVVCEHKNKKVTGASMCAINAAKRLDNAGPVHVLLATTSDSAAAVDVLSAQLRSMVGVVDHVHVATHSLFANPLPTHLSALLLQHLRRHSNYSHVLAPHSVLCRDTMPMLAGALDATLVTDVTTIHNSTTFTRPIYAGNAMCTLTTTPSSTPILLTIRPTAFTPCDTLNTTTTTTTPTPLPPITSLPPFEPTPSCSRIRFIRNQLAQSDRPELGAAKVVIAGGRGLKNGDNFKLLYDLADKFPKGHAAVGASRAAVDAGFVPNDLQIGQTGKIVAPQLYVAVGISGAIQHVAGMKDSKVIVAINKDPEAPIFQVADYALVDDLFKALPELTSKL